MKWPLFSRLFCYANSYLLGESVGVSQIKGANLKLFTQRCQNVATKALSESNVDTSSEKVSTKTKLIKVALFGRPNVGKSTLINQIVGRTACPVSMKAHTTRIKVKAFSNVDDTQLVFFDTPGLVSPQEVQRYKFDSAFLKSAEEAIQEADVIGFVQDASYSSSVKIDPLSLRILLLYQRKSSFLVLNKVDAVKKKDVLLQLVSKLTQKTKVPVINVEEATEHEVFEYSNKVSSWPHFSEVFMVSALQGDGVGDIKEYLLKEAQPSPWLLNKVQTNPQKLAVDFVKAACLDYLADEIPYQLQCNLSYCENLDDQCVVEVSILPGKTRHARMIMDKVRFIAAYAEANLASALEKDCRLRVHVVLDED